jgi:hypothetical protein
MTMKANYDGIGPRDVLFGRGGATNNHIGNRQYRSVVAQHQDSYLAALKHEKILIARSIVSMVRQNGGRFLQRDDIGQWVEVTDRRATAKTSQALREGLDIRNQKIRAPKHTYKYLGVGNQVLESTDKRKAENQVCTESTVMQSPATISISGETASVVPDLRDDVAATISFPPYNPASITTMVFKETSSV